MMNNRQQQKTGIPQSKMSSQRSIPPSDPLNSHLITQNLYHFYYLVDKMRIVGSLGVGEAR
jgi:hypothetical protein